ncbi:hypothetical protein COT27_02535 [Candidatus Kuenenbacteria bacterium CG08_land_8_20_14_0_20_37_23]|uniref:Uncharacterized protein n=2 Tax=Candidatus Kueneniibacteriota TaxID=1752740 RepID=A0A2M6XSK6_9BACT|nr:MAG: hypothetical protein AUJ29_02460 [Candidatus Kuenenbacteria bacterium CG1_02_38_13]PIU10559.1 MAG: hypothetical protein COT27_02535 [Candidatus Kuenenbacteria bacterium CG08_land_8_20_14_0_20_37_23]
MLLLYNAIFTKSIQGVISYIKLVADSKIKGLISLVINRIFLVFCVVSAFSGIDKIFVAVFIFWI